MKLFITVFNFFYAESWEDLRRDLKLHYILGEAITFVSGLVIDSYMYEMNIFIKNRFISVLVAAALAMLVGTLAGIGKEVVWDFILGKGDPDRKDAYWTHLGSRDGAILVVVFFSILGLISFL